MPTDTALLVAGQGNAPLSYNVPDAQEIITLSARAVVDGRGAATDFLPVVQLISDAGLVLVEAITDDTVAAGGSAQVSWFPRWRRRLAAAGLTLDYNLGEIGHNIGTTSDTTQFAPVDYQDINAGEGILVLVAAPSVPVLAAPQAHPLSVVDTVGNTYTALASFAFEANPPNVNQGLYVTLFWCPANILKMEVGVDRVFGNWDNNAFDRIVSVWSVRHSGGANTPTVLAATADHDAAVFAAGQVTLVAPNFTPARDQALEFALIVGARVGGFGAFGAAPGFSGFFQAEFRAYTGSKQGYLVNPQTHGANAYLIAGAVPAPFEDDVGVLPGGVLEPSFSGVGQQYSTGTNAWKGIILLGLD